MFLGEFQHTIDDKGRLILPAKFRDALADGVVLVKGLDKCLFIFSRVDWPRYQEKVLKSEVFKQDARRLSRVFFGGASEEAPDKNGRVVVPAKLREFAELDKEVVVVGVSDRLEVWSKSNWESYITEAEATYEQTAEHLADLSL